MSVNLPDRCQVVVIGGGVVGCSVLYHLAKAGISDCILLERHQISSGTTWHSAALVNPLRPSASSTQLTKYSAKLYSELEQETGQPTGWRKCGHLNIAASKDRLTSLKHSMSVARSFGIDVEMISPRELKEKWPLLKTEDLLGAVWMPSAGRVNPTDVCQALLKGARTRGAKVFENTAVLDFEIVNGEIRGVVTPFGRVACATVVNCTGLWGRQLAARAGVKAPLYAAEHYYLLTEPIDGVHAGLPIVRDGDAFLYIREEVGGLLVGCFEPNPKPLPIEKLPEGASYVLLNEDWDHFEPMMLNAIDRIPELAKAQARKLINGPESFTTDHNPILGESPEVRGFFLACGMNSAGVVLAGGVGWATAEWIKTGRAPADLWNSDVRRYMPFQNNIKALKDRIPEVLAEHLMIPWPNREYETVRKVRRSPLHEILEQNGARFSQRGGWERALFFDKNNEIAELERTYGRPNWFGNWRREHMAARTGVALFDQSAFAKFIIQGRDVERFLQRVCANDVAIPIGKLVYTALLNETGGIESDLTITRIEPNVYMAITGSAQVVRDKDWLARNITPEEFVTITDVTSAYAALLITGPNSREFLAGFTSADLGNDAFPFGTAQSIDVGYATALALRVSYAGELGWELYISSDLAADVFEKLLATPSQMPIHLAGAAALASLRIEKGFRSWGHDISPAENPVEAGLMFAVKMDKLGGFIGREALLRAKKTEQRRRLVSVVIDDELAYPHGNEPLFVNGEVCGSLTSASFGHWVGRGVGLGWISNGALVDGGINRNSFEIEIGDQRCPVVLSVKAPYDPQGQRMRT